MRTNIDKINII